MSDATNPPSEAPPATPGDVIRGKWLMDDAATLEEAADRLESYARWLRDLHAAGWTLTEPVRDDYGFLVDPTGNAGNFNEDGAV